MKYTRQRAFDADAYARSWAQKPRAQSACVLVALLAVGSMMVLALTFTDTWLASVSQIFGVCR